MRSCLAIDNVGGLGKRRGLAVFDDPWQSMDIAPDPNK